MALVSEETSGSFYTATTINALFSVTSESADGYSKTIEGNETVYGGALARLHTAGGVSRSKYLTSGAIVGTSVGGWITAEGGASRTVSTVISANKNRAVAIFPQTNGDATISGNSITFTTTSEEEKTTQTMSFGVAGQTSSFLLPESVNHFGGGEFPHGATVVDVGRAGAYVDQIDGDTTSFNNIATTYTGGQSAPISKWQSVVAVGPLALTDNRHSLFYTIARNTSALPPIV
jgi:hypothetical protein